MEITKLNPKDYIASLPDDTRAIIEKLDSVISGSAPKAEKMMWEGVFWGGSEQQIIGYGLFTYVGSNKKEGQWFIVGLTSQKNYISVFINGVEDNQNLVEKYKKELGKVKAGKSSIGFSKLEDINLDTLAMLTKKAFELKRV